MQKILRTALKLLCALRQVLSERAWVACAAASAAAVGTAAPVAVPVATGVAMGLVARHAVQHVCERLMGTTESRRAAAAAAAKEQATAATTTTTTSVLSSSPDDLLQHFAVALFTELHAWATSALRSLESVHAEMNVIFLSQSLKPKYLLEVVRVINELLSLMDMVPVEPMFDVLLEKVHALVGPSKIAQQQQPRCSVRISPKIAMKHLQRTMPLSVLR